mmetsp:Transcript_18224/g.59461  ORF Transcript_18224/g.59461 Transcript_18224/m.59461 type:complete len:446 (+) Transcript_18224:86-1423(+)
MDASSTSLQEQGAAARPLVPRLDGPQQQNGGAVLGRLPEHQPSQTRRAAIACLDGDRLGVVVGDEGGPAVEVPMEIRHLCGVGPAAREASEAARDDLVVPQDAQLLPPVGRLPVGPRPGRGAGPEELRRAVPRAAVRWHAHGELGGRHRGGPLGHAPRDVKVGVTGIGGIGVEGREVAGELVPIAIVIIRHQVDAVEHVGERRLGRDARHGRAHPHRDRQLLVLRWVRHVQRPAQHLQQQHVILPVGGVDAVAVQAAADRVLPVEVQAVEAGPVQKRDGRADEGLPVGVRLAAGREVGRLGPAAEREDEAQRVAEAGLLLAQGDKGGDVAPHRAAGGGLRELVVGPLIDGRGPAVGRHLVECVVHVRELVDAHVSRVEVAPVHRPLRVVLHDAGRRGRRGRRRRPNAPLRRRRRRRRRLSRQKCRRRRPLRAARPATLSPPHLLL